MDGASAVISVASIAIQLADSITKLCNFWSSIKGAPQEIREVRTDLSLLLDVLTQIAEEAQHVPPDLTMANVLISCSNKVKALGTLLNDIEPGFSSASTRVRKWTALKAVVKNEKIRKFQDGLERLKSTLTLVQQKQERRINRVDHLIQQQSLTAIRTEISRIGLIKDYRLVQTLPRKLYESEIHEEALGSFEKIIVRSSMQMDCSVQNNEASEHRTVEASSFESDYRNEDYEALVSKDSIVLQSQTCWTRKILDIYGFKTNNLLGHFATQSSVYSLEFEDLNGPAHADLQRHYEHESSYLFHPAACLIKLGFTYRFHMTLLNSSIWGWKHTLQSFCAVPDDAPIFELCNEGNLEAVRSLLKEGKASVRDTNSYGYTPLLCGANRCHPRLCQFLLSAGADENAQDNYAQSAAILAAGSDCLEARVADVIDTLRLFPTMMDFSRLEAVGCQILRSLMSTKKSIHVGLLVIRWMLRLCPSRAKPRIHQCKCFRPTRDLIAPGAEDAAFLYSDFCPDHAIYAIDFHLNSDLHSAIEYFDETRLTALLKFGPRLHWGFPKDSYLDSPLETPLILAMKTSWTFKLFLDNLAELNVNMDSFIEEELEQPTLRAAGWETETLHALFNSDYKADPAWPKKASSHCVDCSWKSAFGGVQPYWLYYIDTFKNRKQLRKITKCRPKALMNYLQARPKDCSFPPYTATLPQSIAISLGPIPEYVIRAYHSGYIPDPVIEDYIGLDCPWTRDEIVCTHCWDCFQRTGVRVVAHPIAEAIDPPEDEFSPFHLHT